MYRVHVARLAGCWSHSGAAEDSWGTREGSPGLVLASLTHTEGHRPARLRRSPAPP